MINEDVVIDVWCKTGILPLNSKGEFIMSNPLSMSYQEMRDGRADILLDGEVHTFVMTGGTYWQDQNTGETFDIGEFSLF